MPLFVIGFVKAKIPLVQLQVVPEGIDKVTLPFNVDVCVMVGIAGDHAAPFIVGGPLMLIVPVPLKLLATFRV